MLESDARTFKLWLASIAGLGLVWRCAYALASQDRDLPKDGKYFHVGANLLAEGKGFIDPIAFAFTGASIPGAIHPPAWTALLALVSVVGLDSTLEHQLFACLVGAGTIVLVGFTGRRIGGPRSGLVAATIAACYPGFWSYERSLLSETLVIASVAVTILCAYRYLEHPRLGRAIALGACCGALALQRAEQLLLVVLLLAPLVLLTRTVTLRQRMAWLAASTAVCALLVVPWVLYNNSRFQERVFIASNTGTTLSASNCRSTYHGDLLGYRDYACTHSRGDFSLAVLLDAHGDASVLDARLREKGTRYARNHWTRLPIVVAAREGRAWNLFRPFQQVHLDARDSEVWVFRLGLFAYWALAGTAIIGAIILRRRHVRLWPLVVFIVTVAIAIAASFGYTRYRAPADVSIVLLASIAIDTGISRLQFHRGQRPRRPPSRVRP